MTETSPEAAKYDAATRAGLSGNAAADFASLLNGETADDVRANADRLVNLINSITTGPDATSDRATDHSQGRGIPSAKTADDPLNDFRKMMQDITRR